MQELIQKIKTIGATKILMAIGVIMSLSIIHSTGFLLRLPQDVLLNLPAQLIISLNATFIFYVAISFALGRVAATIFSPLMILLVAFFICFKDIFYNNFAYKKFSRSIIALNQKYSTIFMVNQVFFFFSGILTIYLNTEISKIELESIFDRVLFFIFLAFLMGISPLILSPLNFIQKLRNKRRVLLHRKIIANTIMTGVILSIYCSYNIGFLRFSNLDRTGIPVDYKSDRFEGKVKVLINSSDEMLGIDVSTNPPSYVLVTEKFVIRNTPPKDPTSH